MHYRWLAWSAEFLWRSYSTNPLNFPPCYVAKLFRLVRVTVITRNEKKRREVYGVIDRMNNGYSRRRSLGFQWRKLASSKQVPNTWYNVLLARNSFGVKLSLGKCTVIVRVLNWRNVKQLIQSQIYGHDFASTFQVQRFTSHVTFVLKSIISNDQSVHPMNIHPTKFNFHWVQSTN